MDSAVPLKALPWAVIGLFLGLKFFFSGLAATEKPHRDSYRHNQNPSQLAGSENPEVLRGFVISSEQFIDGSQKGISHQVKCKHLSIEFLFAVDPRQPSK